MSLHEIRALAPLILLAVAVSACFHDDDETEYLGSWASVDSVQVESVSAGQVDLVIHGSMPTPCHEIPAPAMSVDRRAREVTVVMRSRVEKEVTCAQVISGYVRLASVVGLDAGTYTITVTGLDTSVDVVVDVPGG